MSVRVMSIVWELDLPPGEKLVLLALADQANDKGLQCWPALSTIAHKSGQNERTVRRAIRSLESKGHLTCHFRAGESTQYHVHPGHHAPPDKLPARTKTTETPDTTPPKPSRTIKTQKDKPSVLARAGRKHPMPEGWKPEPFSDGTQCAEIIALWQPGRLERELSKFRDNHAAKGNLFKDWQAAWRTWVINSLDFERGGNGHRQHGTAVGLRGTRPDPALDLMREGIAQEAAERAAQAADRGAWPALPSLGSG